MRTYETRFCSCGRIHFISQKWFDEVVMTEDGKLTGKEVVLVCRGCGATTEIGLDDWDGESYCYYAHDLESGDIVPSEKQIVILSDGYRIPMCSGGYANGHRGGLWIDEDALVREQGSGDLLRYKEVSPGYGEKSIKDVSALNVRMSRLLRDLDGDKLQSICGYVSPSFDWSGTKFALE